MDQQRRIADLEAERDDLLKLVNTRDARITELEAQVVEVNEVLLEMLDDCDDRIAELEAQVEGYEGELLSPDLGNLLTWLLEQRAPT